MGLLGILSTVTFRCIPAFALKADSVIKTTQEVIENFADMHQSNAYVDMLYFPIIDTVSILAINHLRGAENQSCDTHLPLVKSRFSRYCTTLRLKGLLWILYALQWHALHRRVTQVLVQTCHKPRTGRSDFVLSFTDLTDIDPYPVQDMEIAIPYQQTSTVLGLLRQHFLTTQCYPLLPIHIRCSAASSLWLSPSYKRDVCWLEFWQYPPNDDFFRDMHALLQPLHYRFHWGKQTQASRGYIRPHYEKWEDFAQLRQQWDPQDLFLNSYLESFFGKQP
jgi:L-gulonolactone oxidase